jgi:hypothetical protein
MSANTSVTGIRMLSLKTISSSSSPGYTVECGGVSDPPLTESLELRRQREQESLASFNQGPLIKKEDLGEVHDWLFTHHSTYSPERWTVSSGLSDAIKATY